MSQWDGPMQAGSGAEAKYALGQIGVNRMPTYIERVDQAVVDAEERLKDLKRMKEIFAQHPDFEELLTLVQRGRV